MSLSAYLDHYLHHVGTKAHEHNGNQCEISYVLHPEKRVEIERHQAFIEQCHLVVFLLQEWLTPDNRDLESERNDELGEDLGEVKVSEQHEYQVHETPSEH